MPKFAFCDGTKYIFQLDTAKPTVLPFTVHIGESNIWSAAFTADKEFVISWGPQMREVRKTEGTKVDTSIYQYKTTVKRVRVRNIGGTDRIYFSAVMQGSIHVYEIYYLKNDAPVLYTKIDAWNLTFPNPCDETTEWNAYCGDFAFGDDNTLYLSTGSMSGPNVGLKVGIYRITGAGPDSVTGIVERIYLGDGPIECLCYVSPQTLYFLRMKEIFKLDLKTMTESPVGIIKVLDAKIFPKDITYVGTGLLPVWWWNALSAMKNLMSNSADFLWRFGGVFGVISRHSR